MKYNSLELLRSFFTKHDFVFYKNSTTAFSLEDSNTSLDRIEKCQGVRKVLSDDTIVGIVYTTKEVCATVIMADGTLLERMVASCLTDPENFDRDVECFQQVVDRTILEIQEVLERTESVQQ